MPVLVDGGSSGRSFHPATERLFGKEQAEFREWSVDSIDVGFINNMPDPALESTERQFVELLRAAAEHVFVRLKLFSLPDVPRTELGRAHLSRGYSDIDDLWTSRLDGLIVTGTEPRALSLTDEPYWGTLTKVIDWAEDNTRSTVWSCLAAHAAVLHIDGICRTTLDEKRFGVFECARMSDHPLMAGVPFQSRIPHSRCNELQEDRLTSCHYEILTKSDEAGVDMFVKKRKSLFVFFQGHPEYDQRALLREYRRDIGRFLGRQRETYPAMPQGYFDDVAAGALARFRERALSERREELLGSFPTAVVDDRLRPLCSSAARRIYGNWLSYLSAQKAQRFRSKSHAAELRLRRANQSHSVQGVG